jgi:hypothetical protein
MNELPENLDRQLTAMLASARSEYTEMPPPFIESTLRREFQRLGTGSRRGRSFWGVVSGISTAAVAAVALLLFNTARTETPAAKTVSRVARLEVLSTPAIPAAPARRTSVRRHWAPAHRPAPNKTSDLETTAGFMAIPYTDSGPAAEQLDVYRVQMPRAILAEFGYPINAGSFNSTITADVVVGADGVARAIKFVR